MQNRLTLRDVDKKKLIPKTFLDTRYTRERLYLYVDYQVRRVMESPQRVVVLETLIGELRAIFAWADY